jgi:hypothetical protein
LQFSEKIRNFVTKSHGKIHEIKSIDESIIDKTKSINR